MHMTLIAAVSENNAIGLNGQLLWHLPADMAFFRKMTLGKTVLMGRKTYESIGQPLKHRRNIVLTRRDLRIEGVEIIHDLADLESLNDEIMVIGGAKVYQLCLPRAQRLIITEVKGNFDADTFFPKIDFSQYTCISQNNYAADANNPYAMVFKEYQRIS